MAEEREYAQANPDEEFHEETPQEFAAQPDREFAKIPTSTQTGEAEADPAEADQSEAPDED
jgi:hypothetical protein